MWGWVVQRPGCLRGVERRAPVALALGIVLWLGSFGVSHAATVIVTNGGDGAVPVCPSVSQCTLRRAISTAGAGDTIIFAPGLYGQTITLTQGSLVIDKTLTIEGPGSSRLTVNGGGSAVFATNTAPSAVVVISGITVTGAGNGNIAVVNVGGDLTLTKMVIADSQAGAAAQNSGSTLTISESEIGPIDGRDGVIVGSDTAGPLVVTDSTIRGNQGPAIFSAGPSLTVTRSTITGNTAFNDFGGVVATGTVTISDSTISGNTAGIGGIGTSTRFGGGVSILFGGSLTAVNTTITGNTVVGPTNGEGGGIYAAVGSTMTLTNVTITGNSAPTGGGISNRGPAPTIRNSIIANQTGGGNCSGTGAGAGSTNNLQDSGASCGTGFSTNPTLNLAPLVDNGGPVFTQRLLPGSAALNAGSNAVCSSADARGVLRARTAGDACDVGAYEQRDYVVTTLTDGALSVGSTSTDCSSPCTLRAAVQAAGNAGGADISLQVSGTYQLTIGPPDTAGQPWQGDLDVTGAIRLRNTSGGLVTIQQTVADRVLEVSPGARLDASGVVITGGTATRGGGILNLGRLVLTNVALSGNSATAGGGLMNGGSVSAAPPPLVPASLTNVTISGNTGSSLGGGIENWGDLTITHTTVSANSSPDGAGLHFNGAATTRSRVVLRNSIVAQQTSGANCTFDAGPPINPGAAVGSVGNLQDSGTSCGTGFSINANTQLGALANNGGNTLTHVPGSGSAAVDAADATVCAGLSPQTDQRGVARPKDGNGDTTSTCDIGAAERSIGSLQFSMTGFLVTESSPTASITVRRVDGQDGAVSASVSQSDGTAMSPADYTNGALAVSWTNGDSANKTAQLPIVNDPLNEDNESVNLTLGGFTGGAVLGSPGTATLTITDNDPQPTVSVSSAGVTEGTGSTVDLQFPVALSTASGRSATVVFQIQAGGTATGGTSCAPGVDYLNNGSKVVTFSPGETLKSLTFTVCGDAEIESSETLGVFVFSAVNVTVQGVGSSATGTITDNDTCTPRTPVQVVMSAPSGGSALVTVTGGLGPITKIDFQGGGTANVPVSNAVVSVVGGPSNQTGSFTYTTTNSPSSVQFTVQRAPGSTGAVTLPFVAHDTCGAWPSFVGGGVGAFGP